MENDTYLFSSLAFGRQSAVRTTAGVEGNPQLAAGLLLGSVFLGLGSYFWAYWSQYDQLAAFKEARRLTWSGQSGSLRGVQKVYSYLNLLVCMDLLYAIMAVILAINLLGFCPSVVSCLFVAITWLLSRSLELILHLLNVLLCLQILQTPQMKTYPRTTYLLFFVFMITFYLLHIFFPGAAVFGLAAVTMILALGIIVKCLRSTASPSAAAAQKKPIVLLAMLTFFIVFAPSFILECLVMSDSNTKYSVIYTNVLFFTNIQFFMDGLLCCFILKMPTEEEEPQREQQQQHSMDNINYDSSPT